MQIELTGRGISANIPKVISSWQFEKILLVTGKNSYLNCGAKSDFDQILKPFSVIEFNSFSPNPTYQEVEAGARLCQEQRCDLIIAVGGGSAIDVAKSINAFQANFEERLQILKGTKKTEGNILPLIAVPTTAGTGSEATHFSVIYLDSIKYSLASPALLPTLSVLNPSYTDKLPAYITACTGFDALCQAIESYWSVNATPESQSFSQKAISTLIKRLPEAVNKPNNEVREAIMIAANFAGKAINITKTTAPHALSYSITSVHNIPHGHAVALTLGAFFSHHQQAEGNQLRTGMTKAAFEENCQMLYKLLEVTSGDDACRKWYQIMNECRLEFHLKNLGIDNDNKKKFIISQVNHERLGNHPVILNPDNLLNILNNIPKN